MNDSTRMYNLLSGIQSGTRNAAARLGSYNTMPNAIGRSAGVSAASGNPLDGFLGMVRKKANSAANAIGTTLAAPIEAFNTTRANNEMSELLKDNKKRLNDVYKQFGFKDRNDYDKQLYAAEDSGNQAEVDRLLNLPGLQDALKGAANTGANAVNKKAAEYEDYRKNNQVSKMINQDQGKFLGSAINTLSTGFDVASTLSGLPNGVLVNGVQGGLEGIADELEQNGFKNFDWRRAGSNAAAGLAAGATTGALNKGINNAMAKNGGSLLRGSNILSRGANAAARSGIGRGALSGAVGGAVGAGTGAALAGQDVLGSALQGAQQGALQGGVTGGIMSTANRVGNAALSRLSPEMAQRMQQNAQAWDNWKNSGDDFNQRLTNTINSGDSAVGNWLNGKRSGLLNRAGLVGNSIRDVNRSRVRNMKYSSDGSNNVSNWQELDDPIYPGEKIVITEDGIGRVSNESNNSKSSTAYDVRDGRLLPLDYAMPEDEIFYREYITKQLGIPESEYNSKLINNRAALEARQREAGTPMDNDYDTRLAAYANRQRELGIPSDIMEAYATNKSSYRNPDDMNFEITPNGNVQLYYGGKDTGITVPNRWSDDTIEAWRENNLFRRTPTDTPTTPVNNDYNTGSATDTPTTLSGWIKKAGQRTVEDLNDSNLGMRIKNVGSADEYGDDIRNMKINNFTEDIKNIPGDESIRRIQNVRSGDSDAETIGRLPVDYMGDRSNMPADIDYESRIINNKIMAGNAKNLSVPELAYAVNNYTRSKIIEFDKNGTGRLNIIRPLSNGKTALIALEKQPSGNTLITTIRPDVDSNYIKNLTKNKNASVLYDTTDGAATASVTDNSAASRAMAGSISSSVPYDDQNVNPRGEVDLTGAFEQSSIGGIQNRNRLQAAGQQLQSAAKTQKFSGIYDSLDAKTARRAVETDAPQRLADLGVRSQDYNEYAKTSSYVNRVVTDLAEKSGVKVNVPDLPTKLSADNLDVILSDTALKKYNDYVRKIVPDGDNPSQYSAGYLLKKSRELGNKAANLRGNTDDVRALREALTDAKYTLRDLATNALEGAEITGDLTNDNIAKGLANLGANQKVQDYYTEAVDGKAPSISDYIRRSSLFEQARDMGTQIDAEKYTRSASKAPTNPFTRLYQASGLDKPIETVLRNTIAPAAAGITNAAGKVVEGIGNMQAGVSNPATRVYDQLSSRLGGGANSQPIINQNAINNIIGRETGLDQGEQARSSRYLAAAAQNTGSTGASGSQMAMLPSSGQTALYNTLSAPQSNQLANQIGAQPTNDQTNSAIPRTGDYWTDVIGQALNSAIQAGDVNAFGALYKMYQDQLATVQKGSAGSKYDGLNASQQTQLAKFESAGDAIDQLEDMFNKAGGGQGIIGGNFANFFGNLGWNADVATYNQMAEGMVNQIAQAIGKTDSLNTEGEVKRALQLIPQLTDNAQTAKNKLARLRNMLEDNRQNYMTAYGVAE